MSDAPAKCPYCQAENAVPVEACTACGNTLPWALERSTHYEARSRRARLTASSHIHLGGGSPSSGAWRVRGIARCNQGRPPRND